MTAARLDSYRQIRLGGLDVDAAASLPGEQAATWYGQLCEARQALTGSQDEISQALHALIGTLDAQDPDRKKLVKIRRDLFNSNYAAALSGINSLEGFRDEVESTLGEHMQRLRTTVRAEEQLFDEFDSWLMAERQRLATYIDDDELLAGVAIAAPSLVPSIRRFAGHIAEGRVDKKDRKTERSLLSYVLRAAAKTSPFSTLGPVSLASSERCEAEQTQFEAQQSSRWSIYPIARVLNVLGTEPELLENLDVTISPYVTATDDGVEVERTRWSFKDIDSRDDYAACVESVVTIGQRNLTTTVAELLTEGMTFGELTHSLAEAGDLSAERSRQMLANLLRLGFLDVPALTCHPHGIEDARASVARLSDNNEDLATTLAAYCDRAGAFSDLHSAEDRVNELQSLQELVAAAYEEAGIDGQLPRSVVYEDVLVPAEQVTAPPVNIEGIPFDLLTMLIDLQDDANLKHALMIGYFLHRWGPEGTCPDVSGFLTGFQLELLDSFEGYDLTRVGDAELPSDPWLTWGEAWRWVAGRRRLSEILTAQTEQSPLGTQTLLFENEVDLTAEFEGIAEEVPLSSPPFRHINVLLQETDHGDVLLNDSFGGIGFPVSRFSHEVEDPRRYTADVEETAAQAGVVLAEVAGGALFTNLNAHRPLVEAEIVVPGDPPGSRSERQIEVGDLSVRYAADQKRLVLVDNDDAIVHPIYPGYLVPAATPRHHQVLSLFGPTGNFSRKPADTVESRPEPGTVLASPRIRLGRIVIARARAIVAAVDLPRTNPLTAGGFAEWTQFWMSTGLPQKSFVRILDDSDKRHKPAYHDASLALCFSILHNSTCDADASTYIEVAEALPLPGEGTATVDQTDRASESMVGISLTKDNS
ncbi:lantibiotic dehydratase [Nesterenkonia lacusekhoensis]|uniref:Lantibiotic dehydratase N-terminal domain-containing protein n=1 Tax=Nesterenkonia lacusekhoensis TaxID=150832 RepID=A0ABS4T299_9MICC|nr:lantibiotic dehydratase [Nesterenkonia lacusekhoensis]MBP2318275.1 hypothetical protein [Nesterenkonia lacusekhoensis]